MPRRDEPDIARLYHLHSANVRCRLPDLTVDHDCHPVRFRTYPGAQRLDLPGRGFHLAVPLGEALSERRSVREFDLQPLPFDLLGRLLHASDGLRRPGHLIGQGVAERPAPSAGGLYPLEIYVATHMVVGLPDAIYRYVWLDAGHVGQNLYLVAGALGLGSVAIGGFYDAEVNALLDLPAEEEAIYLFGIGRPVTLDASTSMDRPPAPQPSG